MRASGNRGRPRFFADYRRGMLPALFAPVGILSAQPALAQAAPDARPQTREELDVAREAPAQAGSRPQVTVDDDAVERGPCSLADPAFAQTRVTFDRVTFANLRAVDPAVLDDTWRDMAGHEVPVSALCEVRDRAATALRAMGFLAAVQIPPQRIEKGGDVRMDVLVAKLVEVQVRGDVAANGRAIEAHMARLTELPWFNTRVAERHLMLLGDMPGYQIRLTLKPVKGRPGEVAGDLMVRRNPIEVVAGVQNLAAKATGREGVFATAAFNGLTGLADRTSVTTFNTLDLDEQTVLQLTHDFAIGTGGLRIGGSLLWARSDPDLPLDLRTYSLVGDVSLQYPIERRRELTLRAQAGLEVVNQSVYFAGVPLSRDRLRVGYMRLQLDTIDGASLTGRGGYTSAEPRWRLSASLEGRQGLRGLGASDDCTPLAQCTSPNVPISNTEADPAGTAFRAEARVEFRPRPDVTVALAPRIQYSPDSLLTYEQFSVGNYTVGRGLDPGTLQGDSGAGGSLELRYGKLYGRAGGIAIQPFVFFDAAWAWRNDGAFVQDPQRALTAGGGLRARWRDRIDANLWLAKPLEQTGLQAGVGDLRLLFTIRARLLPWNPS